MVDSFELLLKFGGVEIVLLGLRRVERLVGSLTNGFETGVGAEFRHFIYGRL